jgi:hypothetical protein
LNTHFPGKEKLSFYKMPYYLRSSVSSSDLEIAEILLSISQTSSQNKESKDMYRDDDYVPPTDDDEDDDISLASLQDDDYDVINNFNVYDDDDSTVYSDDYAESIDSEDFVEDPL